MADDDGKTFPDSPSGAASALPGLCGSCRHAEIRRSARSAFLRCRKSDHDRRFPRYPPLPVLACGGYEPGSE